jgi:hypothetical protein
LRLPGADDCAGKLGIIGASGRIPVDEPLKITMRRRDLLLAVTASGAAAAAAAAVGAEAILPGGTARKADKRKPQYRANSAEVQTFYRVNRYPAK